MIPANCAIAAASISSPALPCESMPVSPGYIPKLLFAISNDQYCEPLHPNSFFHVPLGLEWDFFGGSILSLATHLISIGEGSHTPRSVGYWVSESLAASVACCAESVLGDGAPEGVLRVTTR